MKIYLLPVEKQATPRINPFVSHSQGFNVETEFLKFLFESNLITQNLHEADFHYLPIFWSHWQLANNYGKDNRDEMQSLLNSTILDDKKTFTVSEADNEPGFEIGETKVFSGNQTVGYNGHIWTAIPIVTLPHRVPTVLPAKKYLSNFVGTLGPWPIRQDMYNRLKDREDTKFIINGKGEEQFVNAILESWTTLCPRGSALGSYRFYESMQLGVTPIMIADEDFRPFKNKINWTACSYYAADMDKTIPYLNSNEFKDKKGLAITGSNAKDVWDLLYANWPKWILELL